MKRLLLLTFAVVVADTSSGLHVASAFSQASARPAGSARSAQLADRLTDREFWTVMTSMSEPDGTFRSDNLVSNEIKFQWVVPELLNRVKPGGVYVGVGPEQNFTYLAALKPKLAFIVDVRRGNTDLHLMYKALFEVSADRAEFVSRLLSRPRPAGLTTSSSAAEMFAAFAGVAPSDALQTETLATLRHQLTTVRGFPLSGDDLMRIEDIHRVFLLAGTKIQYSPYGSFGGTTQPTYAELMEAADEAGTPHSFLATETAFAAMRDLERRNALVPLVGDFGGPKTLRAIGAYLRRRGASVSAFYVSNVEEYLKEPAARAFCENVASMPLTADSVFIRALRGDTLVPANEGFVNQLTPMQADVRRCVAR